MTDLVTFVRARLDDREQSYGVGITGPLSCVPDAFQWVRRDLEAKRAIVDEYELAHPEDEYDQGLIGREYGLEIAVIHIAAIDSSHVDYDESWRP